MDVQSDRVTAPMVSLRPAISPSRLAPAQRGLESPVQAKFQFAISTSITDTGRLCFVSGSPFGATP